MQWKQGTYACRVHSMTLHGASTVARAMATTTTLHFKHLHYCTTTLDCTTRKVLWTLDLIPGWYRCVRTSVTASSCVDGSTLLRDTVSSKRNTKLKVLLTKLDALYGVRYEDVCESLMRTQRIGGSNDVSHSMTCN